MRAVRWATAMKRSLLALPFLLLPDAAVQGQGRWSPDAPANRQVLPTFNYSTVEGVLDEIGARHERRGGAGRPSLLVTFQSGRRAAIVFGSCSEGGETCRAISLQSGWTLPRGVASQRAADLTQAFARRYAFSRAFVLPNGNLALQRYLTADYGFIRGNLAVNLLAFAAQLDLFAREVLAPLSRR